MKREQELVLLEGGGKDKGEGTRRQGLETLVRSVSKLGKLYPTSRVRVTTIKRLHLTDNCMAAFLKGPILAIVMFTKTWGSLTWKCGSSIPLIKWDAGASFPRLLGEPLLHLGHR